MINSAFRHRPNGCLDQLDTILALGAALFLHPINKSTSCQLQCRILHTLAKYPFGCDFYNQNMIHLTENQSKETFQARITKLIHTKHDINP